MRLPTRGAVTLGAYRQRLFGDDILTEMESVTPLGPGRLEVRFNEISGMLSG